MMPMDKDFNVSKLVYLSGAQREPLSPLDGQTDRQTAFILQYFISK